MTQIGIDCRFAGTGTGLARYTVEITKALLRQPGSWTLFVRDTDEPWLKDIVGSPTIVHAPFKHYSLSEQTRFPGVIRKSGVNSLFVPHFNAPVVCPVPFVITIHDLILHRYPNAAPALKRTVYRCIFRSAVRRASRIIAVSYFVAGEITAGCGPDIARKTTVVTEGVDPLFSKLPREQIDVVLRNLHISEQYFLYVGNAKQHKNVQTLIDGFERSGVKDATLLLVTGGPEAKRLRMSTRVRMLSDINDAMLAALYSGARAFVTASLYEGFCLPVAEAIACGCPVIASNRSAIPEIAGRDALLIEPTVENFAAAFMKPPAPPQPRRIGSWGEAGRKTAELLRVVTES